MVAAPPLTAQTYDTDYFDALRWRNIGIDRGGRSIGVAGSDSRPYEYYFGATGGGLWKTTDAGQTWRVVTDGKITSSSVGAVAVCEADPDVVYIGTGETQLRGNVMQGDGVYKSTNGGNTWTHLGLEETQNIARVRVHPTDCNTAWVAAFGKHSMENPERGIYKTTDGGETWRKVLYRDDRSGGVDLTFDPGNPDVMYAALWEAWRKSWGMSSGGPGSGLFKSTNGGETWTELSRNPGLPQEGLLGKIGVAVSPANPQRVWALIEHENGGVFRSDDGGATWELINDERKLRQRAFYYTRIYADPQDEDVVYALNTGFYRSRDGGKTFPESIRVPHGDNHDLWIAPSDPDRMINSNDGGGNVTLNGGQTWTDQDYPTAQFYRVITTHHEPYMVCGAQQDNSTACTPWKGWNHLSAAGGFGGGGYFFSVGGCESGYIAPDPKDTDIYFAGCYGGSLSRYDHDSGETRAVNVWPENPMGQSAEDLVERVQWTFPIIFSPVDPNILYTGTQKVWKSTTEGQSWEQISEDLTRADPSTIGPSGGPITRDQTGVETYATIFAIAPSYHDVNVIWAGSDDGLVHVTRDGGATWTNVTPPDAPDFVRINTIEPSPNTPGKAYVAGIRYLVDNDRSPYIWKTTDYGRTWTKIVEGIPADDFVRAVREDPARPGLLYGASETTVYVSWDDGAHWSSLGLNLPNTQVSDLVVEENDLVVSTHGRSFWVLPAIGPIRQMSDRITTAPVHLFDPADPVRGVDQGVDIYYYLAEDAEKVTLEFADARGQVIQTFESA
ncbi:MAG: glycosyl hydrolase, partial [Gemmatimonadetes bacterium]|nr:glycosyl hydrolase [Gemmatimonadota bacterium]